MATASATSFFGIRDEDQNKMKQQQQQVSSTSMVAQTSAPVKRKRNPPGTLYPDAEVIALSPKSLMATNRFICEVCNKGFQREQNLQLHRRGHNLPWKLRQKSTKEVRKKVYLCPEPTCIHHDPSRPLGDLTGIKKHFSRKHGEKKWKCEKCSKKYAVQSDWKAHSKTCGTREYRCDCGTLFSRRDSFITHRAFCDALAQENTRLPPSLNTLGNHLFGNTNTMNLTLSHQVNAQLSSLQDQTHPSTDLLRLGGSPFAHYNHLPQRSSFQFTPNQDFNTNEDTLMLHQTKPFHGFMQLPELNPNNASSSSSPPLPTSAGLFNLSFFMNDNVSSNQNAHHLLMSDQFNNSESPNNNEHSTSLFAGNLMNNDHHDSSIYNTQESVLPQMSATALLQKAAQMGATTSSGASSLLRSHMDRNETNFNDLMYSLANGSSTIFGGSTFRGDPSGINCDGLTRDFLGVGSIMRGIGGGISQREQHQLPMDSELNFDGRSLQ